MDKLSNPNIYFQDKTRQKVEYRAKKKLGEKR